MVRGQEQMDMSALDKSLDEVIQEQKSKKGKGRGRGRGRGGNKGRGRGNSNRGRGRGRGGFKKSPNRNFNNRRGRGGRFNNNNFRNTKFNRPRSMKRGGAMTNGWRGASKFKASPNRNRFGQKPLHRPSGASNSFSTQGKVIVTNLKKHVSSDDIKEIFEKFGTVTQAFVKFDGNTGASTGIAEVYYARGAEARNAQKELDGAKIDNGVIRVRLAIPNNFRGGRGRSRGRGRGGFNIRNNNRGRGRGRGRGRRNNPLQR